MRAFAHLVFLRRHTESRHANDSSIRPFDRHDWTIHRPTAAGTGGSSYMSGGATQPYTAHRCAALPSLPSHAPPSLTLTVGLSLPPRCHRLLPPPQRRGRQPRLLARRPPRRRRPRRSAGARRQMVGAQEGDGVWLGRRDQLAPRGARAGGAVSGTDGREAWVSLGVCTYSRLSPLSSVSVGATHPLFLLIIREALVRTRRGPGGKARSRVPSPPPLLCQATRKGCVAGLQIPSTTCLARSGGEGHS